MPSLSALRHVCNGSIAAFLATQSAAAASASWNVDANASWATVGSWASVVPGSTSLTTSSDVATFGYALTAIRTVTVDANRNIKGITFSDNSGDGYGYTLSGGPLLLTNAGTIQTTTDNTDSADTINSAIVIEGSGGGATITANSSSDVLSIAGAVSGVSAAGSTTTLTLNGGSSSDNIIGGVIGDGTLGGKLAVTKSGTGNWNLSGANTFSGQLTVQDGFLKIATINNASSAGVLGNSALSVVLGASGNKTGTLDYTGASASSSKGISLATGGTGAIQVDTSGAVLTLSGVISGSGALSTLGYGGVTLSGTNTYTGGTTIYNGVLSLGSAGALGSSGAIGMIGGTLQFSSSNQVDYSSRLSTAAYQSFTFDTNGQNVT